MKKRPIIWMGIFIGATIGAYVPALWNHMDFNMTTIVLSGAGAFTGLYTGHRASRY